MESIGERSVPNDLGPQLDAGLVDPLVNGEFPPLRLPPASPETLVGGAFRFRRNLGVWTGVDHLFTVPDDAAPVENDDAAGERPGENL